MKKYLPRILASIELNTNSTRRGRTFLTVFVTYVLLSVVWSPYINILTLAVLGCLVILLCRLQGGFRTLTLGCLLLYATMSYRFVPEIKGYHAMVNGQKDATLSPYKPGMDHLIYFTGSQIQLQHHANPYDNEVALAYIRDNRVKLHTNPRINLNAIDTYERRGFGYVGTPVTLWLYYRFFVAWMSFDTAMVLWAGLSLIVIWATVALFAWRLSRKKDKVAKTGELLIASSLLVLGFQPTIGSLLTGSIEALYLAPLAVAIYLFAFKGGSTRHVVLASLLLAIATGIKIFPGVLMGYFFILLLKRLVPGWRRGTLSLRAVLQFMEAKAVVAYVFGLFALFVITLQQVGLATIVAWWGKMGSFRDIASVQISSPSLASYLNLWYYNIILDYSKTAAADDMLAFTEKLTYIHWLAVAGIGALILWFVVSANPAGESEQGIDKRRWLMFTAIALAALPTISPHFWYLYLVVISVALVIVYNYSREIAIRWKRTAVQVLLLASIFCMNEYLYKLMFSVVDVVFDLRHSHMLSTGLYNFNLWFLHTTPDAPDAVSLASPYRAILGYPGPLLALIAALIVGLHRGGHAENQDYRIPQPRVMSS